MLAELLKPGRIFCRSGEVPAQTLLATASSILLSLHDIRYVGRNIIIARMIRLRDGIPEFLGRFRAPIKHLAVLDPEGSETRGTHHDFQGKRKSSHRDTTLLVHLC